MTARSSPPPRPAASGGARTRASRSGRGLFLSTDGGENWEKVLAGETATAGAVDVAIDPRDSKIVYAAMWDNFRERDSRHYEGIGSGGVSWSNFSANLPKAPVNDVKVVRDAVVAATDVGVFFRRPGDVRWTRLGTGLPLSPAYELQHQAATDTLFVGTFGRSAWKTSAAVLATPAP